MAPPPPPRRSRRRVAAGSRRSTRCGSSTATTAARSTPSAAAPGRRSCSATASRSRRGCGPSSSTRSPPPGSAPSPSTRAATASRPSGDTGHSLDNLADDLRTVLEGLDLHDVVLVGHSMGGMAVQAFAIRHPDVLHARVRGLVLQSTSSHNLVSDARRVRETLERITRLGPDFATFMRPRNLGFLLRPHRLRRRSAPESRRSDAPDARRVRRRDHARPPSARCCASISPRGCRASTSRPSCSVGTADALTPPRDSRRIADLVPDARLVEYPGAGHMLMYERTDEVDALIMDFARECLAAGRGRPTRRRRVGGLTCSPTCPACRPGTGPAPRPG